ncbi:MAG: DUF3352 domain-containing protein [Chloroflexi bacterium]|nr:DUF3352 domain-containing protein [Chloroflexota bacterium]
MSTSFDKADRKGPNWLLIGGGCLILFICLCAAAIGAVLMAPDNVVSQFAQVLGLKSEAASIDFVPSEAPMYVGINPNFSQMSGYAKMQAVFDKNPEFKRRIDELAKQGAGQGADSDFNFERDIKPWIGGDAGVALFELPPASAASSSTAVAQAKWVVFASTRDVKKSDEVLARLRKSDEGKGATYTEEQYKGATIAIGRRKASSTRAPDSVTAFATFQGQVMVSDNPDALKKAIDTKVAGEKASLKSKESYKALVAKLPKDRALTMVVDMKSIMQQAMAGQPNNPAAEDLAAYGGLALSLGFVEDGIRIDSVVGIDSAKLTNATRAMITSQGANASKALDGTPGTAMVAVSGQNIKAYWDYYLDVISRDAQTKKSFDQALADLKKQSGIDVGDDVISWMTGEFAMDVVPAKPLAAAGPTAPGVGLLLMFEAKDQKAISDKLTKIALALGKQGIQFAAKKVNGVDMQVVKGLEAQGVTVGYGFVEGFLVIGSAEDVLTAAVDARKASLSKDAEFGVATKYLPASNTGRSYVSIQRLADVYRAMLPKSEQAAYDKDSAPLIKPFKSISIAGSPLKDNIQAGVIFIHVAE